MSILFCLETLEVKDVIETNLSFVAALSSPATDEKIELEFREILATGVDRRQTSTIITIDIGVIMGKYLIVISKEKFKEKLIKGSSYAITVSLFHHHTMCHLLLTTDH